MLAEGLGLDEEQQSELLASRTAKISTRPTTSRNGSRGLPVPPNAFIGRVQEIEAITGILHDKHVRLLTLTGPGGVGKTRIAIEVAHRLADSHADGAIFVDLSPVRRPEMVTLAIANRIGIPEQAGRDLADVLAVALQGRHLLMVLDNVEQVVDAAIDIASLLDACPHLTILATSRILLRVSAERVMHINPLALPVDDDVISLQQADAAALFVTRARAVNPQFGVESANASTINAILARLEGMPLAIELAAARIRMLSPGSLLGMLATQLPVLTGGVRDAPDRHRTMRDTIAWSYDLLSPTEQCVYRTLAIFPDGCLLDTAVAVMGVEDRLTEAETLAAVESLVDSSLFRKRDGTDGQVRYRMLQTVREYGLEQLAAVEEDIIARRAAQIGWCIPLARRIEFFMCEPDEVFWLNRVSAEYENLREHLTWLIGHDHIEDALDISGSLATFRILRWHMEEGRQELEMLLSHPRGQEPTSARMRGCIGLGTICNHQADFARAIQISQSGVALAREFDEQRHLAWALNLCSISLFYTGHLDEAEALYREEFAVATATGDTFFIASTIHGRAAIADHRGQLDESRTLLQETLAVCLAAGHVWGAALCKHNLGYQYIRRGDLDEAERLVLEAQESFAEIEGRGGSPGLYLTLADIARLRNEHGEAAQMLERALALARENGSLLDIAYSQLGLARISAHKGDLVTAQEHAYHAIQWYERSGSVVEAVRCLDMVTDISVLAGEAARAAWCIGSVDGVLEKHGMQRTENETGEHQVRVEKVKAQLGTPEWQMHYDRGHAMEIEDILAEVRAWR